MDNSRDKDSAAMEVSYLTHNVPIFASQNYLRVQQTSAISMTRINHSSSCAIMEKFISEDFSCACHWPLGTCRILALQGIVDEEV